MPRRARPPYPCGASRRPWSCATNPHNPSTTTRALRPYVCCGRWPASTWVRHSTRRSTPRPPTVLPTSRSRAWPSTARHSGHAWSPTAPIWSRVRPCAPRCPRATICCVRRRIRSSTSPTGAPAFGRYIYPRRLPPHRPTTACAWSSEATTARGTPPSRPSIGSISSRPAPMPTRRPACPYCVTDATASIY